MGAQSALKNTNLGRDWGSVTERLPLNFANTVELHASTQPKEKLKSYFDLVSWCLAAGLLTENEAQYVLREAENHPSETSAVLDKAIELREIIYRIFSAIANDREAESADLANLNKAHIEALSQAKIVPTINGFDWSWAVGKESLDRMLWPIAHSAVSLLTSEDIDRVGQCGDDRGCGWLFFDTSRNHSRRWCSMEDCGNRAKAHRAHRHYYRQSMKKDI
jgi:predicted RNA-binding Zn ribbon-like protein